MEPDGGGVGCVFCWLVCKEIEGKHLQDMPLYLPVQDRRYHICVSLPLTHLTIPTIGESPTLRIFM